MAKINARMTDQPTDDSSCLARSHCIFRYFFDRFFRRRRRRRRRPVDLLWKVFNRSIQRQLITVLIEIFAAKNWTFQEPM